MQYFCCISLKMALVLLSLLLLVQSPRISASGLLQHRKACGTYHISYLGNPDRELFYIDGNLVEKYLFCKALRIYHENHCLVTRNIGNQYCGLEFSLDKLPLEVGRKFLRNVVREGSTGHDFDKTSQLKRDKYANNPILTPKIMAMAAPAFFVLCCAFLCPCFQARKRELGHTILSKEPNSMDSISSLEMSSVSEKIPASPLRVPPSPSRFSMSPKLNKVGNVHLSMSQVARATHNFAQSQIIGEGGFGAVYKAKLPDGLVVAIKRAKKKEHFEALRTEFKSEVELLAKIDHRNLVKLLGYVDNGDERLIITEYVPNGTLREHLDGRKGKILDFCQRLEISIDVAHGLTYLHQYAEKQIIHRDVKSSNVLLTDSMRAKVADFGFARIGEMDSEKTYVSTQVKGTVGYLDPEYMMTYQLTSKSDVFSFGVLLIEILTGRRPLDLKRPLNDRVTIKWAFRMYNEGKVLEILDPMMKETVDKEILAKMFGLAIQCVAPTRTDRPDMKSVAEQLWGIRMDYSRSGRRD
ncbi:calmodulin-binding receptor-like cytoplasmic kinase 3 [Olea europaea var. sylvestris]|uniref:calmodulin-binding receptor-like cytoplasmic kinase 3 n=1 Tax=Olea europaea var. sylvestris TaxID=158386 RepID=UPI000C1D0C0E|nr:calmodulin-binding receptor-like cytoplasmic kinase 3 [Olea europaea var. sylvestris]XP_022871556.1 calmodulin-binding receptor-like cytoplasmic kinase 3 [Olea europaea var. sylvestris]XP_022871557.1 calmodulin-binding receptor-like cytoplasmic kinase 3 [Olea europaea var. sylvestris]XP_022871558.1 calmodulin-binding receptor-like cytoplasmic kinase 3 [Olea europaea var. sylvestris]XP_022871559.1 calmodulin-binding receptor-like cytoplasmic kinase 3 [Olea europaea var. sylvestris]XP_0228715